MQPTVSRPVLYILPLATTLLAISFALSVDGQDTVYFDLHGKEVESIDDASTILVIKYDPDEPLHAEEKIYSKGGNLVSVANYNPYSSRTRHGIYKLWHNNGRIRRQMNYENGKLDGKLISYWDNGNIKRKEIYKSGKSVKGRCYDINGKRIEFYEYQIFPSFPGGESALSDYLYTNLKYPMQSMKSGVQGKVIVDFIVGIDGSIISVHIQDGINEELNMEAIRVVENMPKWSPGMEDGNYVKVSYRLPISFKLR